MTSSVSSPIFGAIQEVWHLYSIYITNRPVYDPLVTLETLFEGPNGILTIIQRLSQLTSAQARTLAAYTKAAGILVLLANGYALPDLDNLLHIYLDLLVTCTANEQYSNIFTSHLRELSSYLEHLLGAPTDPNLLLEVSATCRAVTQELNLPYRYPLVVG
jgi:hypothetical protein